MPSPAPREVVHRLEVLDSFLSYRETGTGSPVVFLHGNPTSSYVWRNVLPTIAATRRCLAPDLIGMGNSGKPQSAYRFSDHARYLDAWFEKLKLRDVVLVGYDWGGVLALDWAARHPDRVRGVVVFETFLRPTRWRECRRGELSCSAPIAPPGSGRSWFLRRICCPRDRWRTVFDAALPTPTGRSTTLRTPTPSRAARCCSGLARSPSSASRPTSPR